VLVNGRTIPFNMKIGDAGEAFFVLETDAEVPDDLLTSPVLEATRPGAKVEHASDVPAGRFGAKDTAEDAAQEPEYFELDAPASDNTATTPGVVTPTATRSQHSFSQAAASTSTVASTLANVFDAVRPVNIAGAAKAVAHAVVETEQEEMDRLRDRMEAAAHVATHLREPDPFSSMKDEMLPNMDMDGKEPEVVYRNGKTSFAGC
jgi:phosphatidate phosphatase LPIN